jgi:hypothetical protein
VHAWRGSASLKGPAGRSVSRCAKTWPCGVVHVHRSLGTVQLGRCRPARRCSTALRPPSKQE